MLQGISYVPLIHARPAELRAFGELPDAAKNRILPIVLCRPWLNSKSLERLWERLAEALGARQFALELDRSRLRPADGRQAYEEFGRLFDPQGTYSNYYDLVERIPFAVPVLRSEQGRYIELGEQLRRADELGRGAFMHLRHDEQPEIQPLLDDVFNGVHENIVFVINCGWSPDLLGRAAWAISLVREIANRNDDHEIVIIGSSFPNSFTDVGARKFLPIRERVVFDEVKRNQNRAHLCYGDWASTRPPSDPAPMRNTERIDLPLSDRWLSFRKVGEESSYGDVARRAVKDPEWPSDLALWGTYMIESTANGLPGSINTAAAAAAARINVHMHRQTFYDDPAALGDRDEPYHEDF